MDYLKLDIERMKKEFAEETDQFNQKMAAEELSLTAEEEFCEELRKHLKTVSTRQGNTEKVSTHLEGLVASQDEYCQAIEQFMARFMTC